MDASIVPVPRNHNTRDETTAIKRGEVPEDRADKPARRSQKNVNARWREEDHKTARGTVFPTSKHGKSHYGYKNHMNVDRTHKPGSGAITSPTPLCMTARRWITC